MPTAPDVAIQDPDTTMPIDDAHRIMQDHIDCVTARCLPRRLAVAALVKAGHYTLPAQ